MSNEEKNSSQPKEEIKNEGVVKTEQQTSTAPAANQSIINTDAAKAKANEAAQMAKNGYNKFNEKMKNDNKFKQIVIIGAVALVVIIALFCSYLYGGSKGAVKGYAKAYVKMDAKAVVKYFHEDYLDYYDENYNTDLEDSLDDGFDDMEDNDQKFLKYEIIDEDKIGKDDVEDLAEDMDDIYGIDEDDVKAAVVYTIKFTYDDDGDKDTIKAEVTAVKIKSKWYIFRGDLS